jgi:hypothetical protein
LCASDGQPWLRVVASRQSAVSGGQRQHLSVLRPRDADGRGVGLVGTLQRHSGRQVHLVQLVAVHDWSDCER